MPTGHTAPVIDGEINNVSDFALECSKSFVWSWRDGKGLAYPGVADSYYRKALTEEYEKLVEWDGLDEAGKYAKWSGYATTQQKYRDNAKAKAEESFFRLEGLLTAVRQVEVPETHANFKKFMIDQLEETIRFDGTFNEEYYHVDTYPEWADIQRDSILERIERYSKRVREEDERVTESRKWISTLANLFDLKVEDPDEKE